MDTLSSQLIASGVLILLSILSGVWLHKKGRPLNTAIFTIHKLVALATIVLVIISAVHLYNNAEIKPLSNTVVIAFCGITYLALVVSGALLSFEKLSTTAIQGIHKVAPLLAMISSAGVVFLLGSNR
jgi:hypothetical protein